MPKQYWLVKQEPEDYSWEDFVRDGKSAWTGIRNYQARNNLRAMKKDDLVIYYYSGENKQAVGLAKVSRENFPDPTAKEGDWSAVELVPHKPLRKPVSLAAIKSDSVLQQMALVRNTRLSVSPVTEDQFARLMELAETRI
jgi:predicted RNA-binding protein with PUA-like domain